MCRKSPKDSYEMTQSLFIYILDWCFTPYTRKIPLIGQGPTFRWKETGQCPAKPHDHRVADRSPEEETRMSLSKNPTSTPRASTVPSPISHSSLVVLSHLARDVKDNQTYMLYVCV